MTSFTDWSEPEFLALDLETTGLKPDSGEIIEIGVVGFSSGRVVGRWGQLVRPERLPGDSIVSLTGIDPTELRASPPIGEVLPAVLGRLAGRVVVAHNAPFDRSFLAAAARRLGLVFPRMEWVDTLWLARLLLPGGGGYSLPALKARLGIELPSHRAVPDAEAAGRLLLGLLPRLSALGPAERTLVSSRIPPGLWRWERIE